MSDLETIPQTSSTSSTAASSDDPVFLLPEALILTAMAGGMAWGIRGQYGHEVGAMIFGILAGFTLVMLFMPEASALRTARVVALFAVAIGFGGSMSYGETVGLTHDAGVHGNVGDPHFNAAAYRWGMLGLAIKGGLWIGFGGAFLGLGMGGKDYRPREMLGLGLAMMFLFVLGRWMLNSPFDPDLRVLPRIYFSDHWRWEPDENVNPRPEIWGGILFAFLGLTAYLQFIKRDRLARNLAIWGVVGGLGFPIGQSLQASHAWDSQSFVENSIWQYGANSWNMMEVAFGTVAGLALALGVWLNRKQIVQSDVVDKVTLSGAWEIWLAGIYLYLLGIAWYFGETIFIIFLYHGLLMGIIPMAAIVGGRYWPFLFVFPIVAMPIAVKTFLALCREAEFWGTSTGLLTLVTLPLILLTLLAQHFGNRSVSGLKARPFSSIGLAVTSTVYFWLNFAFFSFPWQWWSDWQGWAGQRNSGAVYVICWLALMTAAIAVGGRSGRSTHNPAGATRAATG